MRRSSSPGSASTKTPSAETRRPSVDDAEPRALVLRLERPPGRDAPGREGAVGLFAMEGLARDHHQFEEIVPACGVETDHLGRRDMRRANRATLSCGQHDRLEVLEPRIEERLHDALLVPLPAERRMRRRGLHRVHVRVEERGPAREVAVHRRPVEAQDVAPPERRIRRRERDDRAIGAVADGVAAAVVGQEDQLAAQRVGQRPCVDVDARHPSLNPSRATPPRRAASRPCRSLPS